MSSTVEDSPSAPQRSVNFWEAFRFWLKLGFISFGGPTGQIAIMHSELVEKQKWISDSRFLHALNYCMLLPGPEAQQLAIYIGWLLHKTIGGIVAGAFFVIPSMFILWTLSYVYAAYGNVYWIASIFYGLKGAVIAIVAVAVIRIGRKALKNEVMWIIAAAAFVAIFFLKVPFPLIILTAGLIGLVGGKFHPSKFLVIEGHTKGSTKNLSVIDDYTQSPDHAQPSVKRAVKILLVCLVLWWTPVFLSGAILGWNSTIFREGLFFSKAAMITFGGAYAVLPYVSQQAVESYHWLSAGQMIDGLGLAETTPGPLIMVVQFVGFMGGWNQPGNLNPLSAATLGAFITTWVTFVPCFMWIFLGAPYVEQLRGNTLINSSLSTITAAVVGVILNLAVWFALHALFPKTGKIDFFVLTVTVASFIALFRFKLSMTKVVLAASVLGICYRAFLSYWS
jgi:chromate transporter